MADDKKRRVSSDDGQESDEARTETYKQYDEGAPESLTQPSAESNGRAGGSATRQAVAANTSLEEAIVYAKKYLEDLLSFFGLNTDVHATSEDDEVIELDIPSTHLNGFLIGQRGDTMRALQFIISSALRSQNFEHTRINIDVAEYKKQRAQRLTKQAEIWFKEAKDKGQPKDLPPMNAADRRVVHKAASDYGIETESVGFGRDRHIVLKPTAVEEEAVEPKASPAKKK